jgi:outer membrane autotransporter protein
LIISPYSTKQCRGCRCRAGRCAEWYGSDQKTSTQRHPGRAAIVSDYGVAVARQFDLGGVPVSGTPKLQKTWVYNYTTSIYDYDSNKWNDSRYRTDDTGFNVDAGIAADFGEHWTVGVSGQNLMSRDIDTKDIRIRNGRTGEVVS